MLTWPFNIIWDWPSITNNSIEHFEMHTVYTRYKEWHWRKDCQFWLLSNRQNTLTSDQLHERGMDTFSTYIHSIYMYLMGGELKIFPWDSTYFTAQTFTIEQPMYISNNILQTFTFIYSHKHMLIYIFILSSISSLPPTHEKTNTCMYKY